MQPTSKELNDHIMDLILMFDAAIRASVAEIDLVVPYFGFARQDRKYKPRVPISSTVIAKLFKCIGAESCESLSENLLD